MLCRIKLFARARDLAGTGELTLELPPATTVGGLRRFLGERYPALRGLLERSALAVNEEFAGDEVCLSDGVEIALLPPVSGG